MMGTVRKYLEFYRLFFVQYWKSRMVYKWDFILGFSGQFLATAVSIAFITLLYTQTNSIGGWGYYEILFLSGFGGTILFLHHVFLFNIFHLGEDFIIEGRMDRLLVRPLSPLFQVYAHGMGDDDLSKLIVNAALVLYVAPKIGIALTPANLLYGAASLVSGVLFIAGLYLAFATTAFWTGKSEAAISILFTLSEFRKYPYSIYGGAVQVLLVTLIPIGLAILFPASYLLGKPGHGTLKIVSVLLGPVFFYLAYRFWRFGLSRYSSTGT
ncbi:MAG: ABC-2 family transporter protein [Candidatus Nanohaloarchaea archaeon]|nr:ABC-2 family transporter protein [Candidatus Nanohaloarchaea archaeon]